MAQTIEQLKYDLLHLQECYNYTLAKLEKIEALPDKWRLPENNFDCAIPPDEQDPMNPTDCADELDAIMEHNNE